jgi:hypothetical protein
MPEITAKPMPVSIKRWHRWLIWGVVAAGVTVVVLPTILMPAADRIYFAIEERRLNDEFRRNGINGRASFVGRLFDGTMYINATNLDDSQVPSLAKILGNERSILIGDSALSWQGLQHLVGCKKLKYIMFVDAEVTDADLEKLQEAMPNSKVTAKWQHGDRFFEGKP